MELVTPSLLPSLSFLSIASDDRVSPPHKSPPASPVGSRPGSLSETKRPESASSVRRPGSSEGQRPGSSSSMQRPGSSSSVPRPGSSLSMQRPGSSSNTRPGSSSSIPRPGSASSMQKPESSPPVHRSGSTSPIHKPTALSSKMQRSPSRSRVPVSIRQSQSPPGYQLASPARENQPPTTATFKSPPSRSSPAPAPRTPFSETPNPFAITPSAGAPKPTGTAPSLTGSPKPIAPNPTRPVLNVKLTLPKARHTRNSTGLRLRLTATLTSPAPISFLRRGTIFDDLCPLLGRGGFWGIADAQRRPVRFSESQVAGTKACLRSHAAGEALLDFDGCFVTLRPGESVVVEKVLPVVGLVQGEAYTVYSRPDREKKRASRARWRYGTREELAESAFWVSDEEEEGGEEEWCRVDVSHVVRNRGWEREDMEVVVGNSVRFHVV